VVVYHIFTSFLKAKQKTIKEGYMKKNIILAIFFVTFFLIAGISAVTADEPVNMTGTWDLSVETPSGQTGNPVFILKQDGVNLTGTYKGFFGDAPVTGFIKGQDLEMKYTLSGQTTVYKGKSDGKRMSGKIDFAGQGEGTFTGIKQKK